MDYRGVSPMTGNLAENWKIWQQKFENYLISCEINKMGQDTQTPEFLDFVRRLREQLLQSDSLDLEEAVNLCTSVEKSRETTLH